MHNEWLGYNYREQYEWKYTKEFDFKSYEKENETWDRSEASSKLLKKRK